MAASFNSGSRLKLTWEDPKTKLLRKFAFDVVTAESYEALMSITSHPVEKGADVTDHAREEPIALTIEGLSLLHSALSKPRRREPRGVSVKPLKPLYPPKLGGAPSSRRADSRAPSAERSAIFSDPPKPPEANSLSFTSPGGGAKARDRHDRVAQERTCTGRTHPRPRRRRTSRPRGHDDLADQRSARRGGLRRVRRAARAEAGSDRLERNRRRTGLRRAPRPADREQG